MQKMTPRTKHLRTRVLAINSSKIKKPTSTIFMNRSKYLKFQNNSQLLEFHKNFVLTIFFFRNMKPNYRELEFCSVKRSLGFNFHKNRSFSEEKNKEQGEAKLWPRYSFIRNILLDILNGNIANTSFRVLFALRNRALIFVIPRILRNHRNIIYRVLEGKKENVNDTRQTGQNKRE